jgi:prepilin-type N-terminal cleavage/methylation domain-containing protein
MTPQLSGERGFTIVEVLIAVIVLSVGLLGLVSTSAAVTRMIGRGQRSETASIFAAQRVERLRPAACIPAQRVAGTETLYRGSQPVARNAWTFTTPSTNTVRIFVVTQFVTSQGRTHTDTSETQVTCLT